MGEIVIYCDGGCRGNAKDENIGGYGVVLQYTTKNNTYIKELYEGERNTTNNIQELKGAIKGLEALKTTNIPVRVYCDSAYVINGITSWVSGWKKNGWKKKGGEIKNLELWKHLDELVSMQDDCQFIKIKGHAGHEGNERADELANIAMDGVE